MRRRGSRRAMVLGIPLLGASLLLVRGRPTAGVWSSAAPAFEPTANVPPLILYSWERAENLAFLDSRRVGVAFFAATIYLRGDEVVVRPRMDPLETAPGTWRLAVARVESHPAITRAQPPDLSRTQGLRTAAAIGDLARIPGVRGVQVDFDATPHERAFYRELLRDVRRQLPAGAVLSITALASWCADDAWMQGLEIDEAVPLLYRMGPERPDILRELSAHGGFSPPLCGASLGISTDEPLAQIPRTPHLYLFNPHPWTKAAVERWAREVHP
jgi:hypothetical protein